MRSDPAAAAERRTEDWLDETGVPGVSVAVVDGEETVYAGGVGRRSRDPPAQATADTVYGVGSVTKPITATAVLTLVERGVVALDDPVAENVDCFAAVPGDHVTVRDLLSHTSGLPDDDSGALILDDPDDCPSIDSWADLAAHVRDTADARLTDRDRCLYYNTGYSALGRLVEIATGRPFPEYVSDHVLDPLGMAASTFDAGVLDDGDVMTPYAFDGDEYHPGTLPDPPLSGAAGGLLSPVLDLAAFLSASMEGGPHLGDDLRERAFEPVATYRRLLDGTDRGYGLGWETRPFESDTLIGHSGGTGVSSAYAGFLRERGLGVAVACNAHPPASPEDLAATILADLTGRDPASVVPALALDRTLTDLPGRYESVSGAYTAAVRRDGPGLELQLGGLAGGDPLSFDPVSLDPDERVFRAVEGDGGLVTAEFFVEDGIELLFEGKLFTRIGDLDEDDEE